MPRPIALVSVLLFAGVVLWRCNGAPAPLSAERLVQGVLARVSLPMDLGEGLRLERIEARGNAMVSTVSLVDTPPGELTAAHRRILADASRNDTCREIAPQREVLAEAGIEIVKEYLDREGGLLLSVRTHPGECD